MKKSDNENFSGSDIVTDVSRRFLPPEKFILDACCGGRWFWFDKRHPNAVYVDVRVANKGHDKYRKNHSVEPDMVMDFRNLEFHDEVFQMVIFDPPHMVTLGKTSKFRGICKRASGWDE